ncbi:MAG: hypothetical protein ABI689_05390 [Thermoanaerobaculia bacterium]
MSGEAQSTAESRFRSLRAALANLRAAAETLEAFPEMEIVRRTRLLQVLIEEIQRLSVAIAELQAAARPADADRDRAVKVEDLVFNLEAAIVESGLRLELAYSNALGADVEVTVEPRELGRELTQLARGLRTDLGVDRCQLTLGLVERYLRLDLGWSLSEGDPAATWSWVLDALAGLQAPIGASGGLRELVRQHGGEVWFTLGRDDDDAHLRLLLPLLPQPVPI